MTNQEERPETLSGGTAKYKSLVKDFGKGSDDNFLHFSIGVNLQDTNKVKVGQPDQVYLAFKKKDIRESDQLQINAQAALNPET